MRILARRLRGIQLTWQRLRFLRLVRVRVWLLWLVLRLVRMRR
jgi:hypothetical protein